MSTLYVNTITPQTGDTVSVSGSLFVSGNINLGDANTDGINFNADVDSNITPNSSSVYTLGEPSKRWSNVHSTTFTGLTASFGVVSGSLIPNKNNKYNLGSPTHYWKDIYVSSGSIKFVSESGLITDLSQENIEDIKSGKSLATIGGFSKSTRHKAIFQDDDTSTYKKMTIKGRVSQFISGVLVKDYNKSGSNSYSKKDGIDVYEWNSAKSMSFNSTHSFWNVENMSMDISEGGFYGLAVSGSTLASNLHNMANNTSGLFLTGSNVIISGSTSFSGSTVITGGDTEITGSTTITGSTAISGGFGINNDGTSSIGVTTESISLDVSGSGSNLTVTTESIIIGGITTFITGTTSQSGDTILDSGSVTIINTNYSSALSGGEALIVTEGSGSGSGTAVIDTILTGFTNQVPISSSFTLLSSSHAAGRQINVRSGSINGYPQTYNYSNQSPYYGLPNFSGSYKVDKPGPAGILELSLPAAHIGVTFHIVNYHYPTYTWGDDYFPSIKISPNGNDLFIQKIAGGLGAAGKGIVLPSGSSWTGDNVQFSCVSHSAWCIQYLNGDWVDEA